jgi:hypothetical protein
MLITISFLLPTFFRALFGKPKMFLYALTDEESKAIYFTAKDPSLLEDYKVKFDIRGDHLKIIKLVEE